jgi:putative N6-adenine-specific DNA methylase
LKSSYINTTSLNFFQGQFQILIRTYSGLEEVLYKEVTALGGANVEKLNRAVSCTGDLGFVYKLNLALRTAVKVLVPLNQFVFHDNKSFYDAVYQIDWPGLFAHDKTIAFDSIVFSRYFDNSMFVSQLAKDAVADRFRKAGLPRPFVDARNPDVPLSIYVKENEATVYLDSSGMSLHQRGYKPEQVHAPLSEVMAAGILKLSGWSPHFPLIDPMCGSGTFSIEAAMLASGVPAGMFRKRFGFEQWKAYDAGLYEQIFTSLVNRISESPFEIHASDRDARAIAIAKRNAEAAQFSDEISFSVSDFLKSSGPERKAFLFMNPPYGERLNPDDLAQLYAGIGATLKHRYAGCEAWVFTAYPEAVKQIGLKPSTKIKLMNGPLECLLLRYEMFAGKRNEFKKQN